MTSSWISRPLCYFPADSGQGNHAQAWPYPALLAKISISKHFRRAVRKSRGRAVMRSTGRENHPRIRRTTNMKIFVHLPEARLCFILWL
jgi:hypothetical protein